MFSMQLASAASRGPSTVAKRPRLAQKVAQRFAIAAALAVAAFASSAVHAQNLKIGVINVGRLLEQAPQSVAVSDKLKEEFAARQRAIVAMQQKLQTQSDTFTKDAPVMGEAERLNLEREIRDGQRDLQRSQNEYVEDLNVRRNEEVGKLQREVLQQVQAYAAAQKYDLIIADAIYASSAVDITAAVLETMKTAPRAGSGAAPRP